MIWYLAELLGLIQIDRNIKQYEYQTHPSYAGNFIRFGLDGIVGEYVSTVCQTFLFALALYFTLSCSSYYYFFKKNKELYLPKLNAKFYIFYDIKWSIINMFFETFLVSIIRVAQPRFSLMYYNISDYGYWYIPISIILHIIFDETLTYWVHRWLHTYGYLYIKLHRIHHFSKDITPFSGFAFHPLDAFAQAVPLFTSCFLFPIHMNLFLFFGLCTTSWAISIHDNVPALPLKFLLYSTHHTIHHEPGLGGMKNFGKFTSIWDRIMGTYEEPDRINFGWKQQQQQLNKLKKVNDFYESILPSDLNKIQKKQ
ncbi:unnamed protein product [Paramecium sonneborni]|uniref:Fatty acid hydroxylase domain-containing protein n=1 Tax=Paramecium sonneborni TaxID=65129 RepID=A0A8S1N5J2_9CILI|nr:unnamed protein product [Paramecium sonneborni]